MRYLLALFLMISINGFGQWKSYIISVRGDTLNRVDLKGKKQGPWVVHIDALRGEQGYDEQGYFVDDHKDGLWTRFSLMGDKIAEENFRWGSLDGKSRYYSRVGQLEREESWRATDPTKTMDTVDVVDIMDPTKVVDQVIVPVTPQSKKHGVWTYYDAEWGTVVRTENYFLDKVRNGNGEVDENGDIKPLDVSASRARSDTAGKKKPQIVLDYEKKNSGKKKVKTRDGNTGY